ncbi:hypothetical protein FRC0429_00938 [Corynebacterium diphtheriae]|nr:hypothetical protein FRC0429_00938 [Corynebacterium diphtheriae]
MGVDVPHRYFGVGGYVAWCGYSDSTLGVAGCGGDVVPCGDGDVVLGGVGTRGAAWVADLRMMGACEVLHGSTCMAAHDC